jgi:hypothetical protein
MYWVKSRSGARQSAGLEGTRRIAARTAVIRHQVVQ